MVQYRRPDRLSSNIDDRRSQATQQDRLRSALAGFGKPLEPRGTPKPKPSSPKPTARKSSGAAAQVSVPRLRSPRSHRTRRQTTKRPTSWPR